MKKTIILILSSLFLCGCASEPIKAECDVITIRPYSEIYEKGVFTKKQTVYDFIEYTYEYNGEIHIDVIGSEKLKVGKETKVLITDDEGYISDNLQLSLEDYKELYNLN